MTWIETSMNLLLSKNKFNLWWRLFIMNKKYKNEQFIKVMHFIVYKLYEFYTIFLKIL
jgi:hypothetical protein